MYSVTAGSHDSTGSELVARWLPVLLHSLGVPSRESLCLSALVSRSVERQAQTDSILDVQLEKLEGSEVTRESPKEPSSEFISVLSYAKKGRGKSLY